MAADSATVGWRDGGAVIGAGLCARTAASFCVFLTLGAVDFWIAFFGAAKDFRAAAARGEAFLPARCFATDFGFVTTFFVDFFLGAAFALAGFRATVFLTTALFAFGRAALGLVTRFFAAVFGEERRAAARDVERLKLFGAALILSLKRERVNVDANSAKYRAEE